MPFAAMWMNLETITQNKVIEEKDKYHMISLTCGICHMTQMNISMKQTDSDIENRLMAAKGEVRCGRNGLGV